MALLRLNTNALHLDILIGTKEKFEPKESIIELDNRLQSLKSNMLSFLQDTFNTQNIKDVSVIIAKDKDLESKWIAFLDTQYKPEIEYINKKCIEINKEICLNYSEIITE